MSNTNNGKDEKKKNGGGGEREIGTSRIRSKPERKRSEWSL